jgi:endoglucanase
LTEARRHAAQVVSYRLGSGSAGVYRLDSYLVVDMPRTSLSRPTKSAEGWRRLGVALRVLVIVAYAISGYGLAIVARPSTTYARLQEPFHQATLFRAPDTAADRWKADHRGATWLDPITSQPQAVWLNNPQDLADVRADARQAQQQGALPVFVAYYLPRRDCWNQGGAPSGSAYDRWIDQLIAGIRPARTAIIMEPDAVAADCFNAERAALLKRSVKRLVDAGQYVYLDAGHSRWKPATEMAERLIESGIQYAEGFSVNVSNRQTTTDSYAWGRTLSNLVGYRDFVIDTSRNGRRPPPAQADNHNAWCNPAGQALGEMPSTATRRPHLAATLWIKGPGESDGYCGTDHTYDFSPRLASELIANSAMVPEADRRQAARAQLTGGN